MTAIDRLIPDDPLQAIAWVDCLRWAIGEPEVVEAFRRDTGNRWKPGASGLERMIDEATGADREFIEAFAAWFDANVWGKP